MNWLNELGRRILMLVRRWQFDLDLDEEMRLHRELREQELVKRGLSPQEAHYATQKRFGNDLVLREESRDMWGWNWLENLLQDVRYGLRMLVKNPGFTTVAVITLALGIGANTAIFSVVNGVLLRPLPYREPDRVVVVMFRNLKTGETFPLCDADFLDWQAQNQVFESVAAFSGSGFNLTGSGPPAHLFGDVVTAKFFSTLGVKPVLGRTFLPQEDKPGSPPVVVLSHSLWQERYGSDPNLIGQSIELNATGTTVIGIMPANFLPGSETRLWADLVIKPPRHRGPYYLTGEARLKPGATMADARADLDAIHRRIEAENPLTNAHIAFQVTPLEDAIVGEVRPALLLLLGAVTFVLLIASANVAHLFLARATVREKEFSVRLALGASRSRLVLQLLTESILLAAVGGIFGLVIAKWGVRVLLALSPSNLPRLHEIRMDGSVLGFTCVIALTSGILFGLSPAIQSGRAQLNESLKEGGRTGSGGPRRSRARNLLAVAEIAMSFVLLVGAGLMLKSFSRLETVSPGINPSDVLTAQIELPSQTYRDDNKVGKFYQRLLVKVEALPGAESAGVGMSLPPNLLTVSDYFTVEGQRPVSERELGLADVISVSPDYFRALGVPLLEGRLFNDQDRQDRPKVVIINQTLARRNWPNESPIGKRLKLGGAERPNNPWKEVVGVVGDVKYSGLEAPPEMVLYEPYLQSAWSSMYLVVRTSRKMGHPADLSRSIASAVWSLDKDVPVADLRTMEQRLSDSLGLPRFRTVLLVTFAIIALSLAVVGIYGILSYSVTERRHEIGIRVALGADHRRILKLVIRQGMALALTGVAIGIAGAVILTRFMSGLLYGVKPTDPLTFGAVAVILTVVALAAITIPARRAAKLDPMVALRHE